MFQSFSCCDFCGDMSRALVNSTYKRDATGFREEKFALCTPCAEKLEGVFESMRRVKAITAGIQFKIEPKIED